MSLLKKLSFKTIWYWVEKYFQSEKVIYINKAFIYIWFIKCDKLLGKFYLAQTQDRYNVTGLNDLRYQMIWVSKLTVKTFIIFKVNVSSVYFMFHKNGYKYHLKYDLVFESVLPLSPLLSFSILCVQTDDKINNKSIEYFCDWIECRIKANICLHLIVIFWFNCFVQKLKTHLK